MLRRISDMPLGTIGFEGVGEVEDDDWEEAVEPTLTPGRAVPVAAVDMVFLLSI